MSALEDEVEELRLAIDDAASRLRGAGEIIERLRGERDDALARFALAEYDAQLKSGISARTTIAVAVIADLRARLETSERELAGARGHAIEAASHRNVALDRADTAERKCNEYLAACQQKHGVHPDWITRATVSAATIAELAASLEAAESYAVASFDVHYESILRFSTVTQTQRETILASENKLARVRKLMSLPLSVHRSYMIDRVLAVLDGKDVT